MSFYLLCLPFFIVSAIHIATCFFPMNRLSKITKVLTMPLLALAVLLLNDAGNKLYLTCALIAGCFGDYFLLRPVTKKKFLRGVFSFFIGHAFYLLILIPLSRFWLLPPWCVVIIVIVYSFVVFGIYNILKRPKGIRGFAAVVYAFMLLLINFTCLSAILTVLFDTGNVADISLSVWLIFAGNMTFLVSDSLLSITMFKEDFKFSRVAVMTTYLAAQFLLVLGLIQNTVS
ncbi:MAG: lysoplasmalogenase [Treponemataceae bacterium]|nr:lysoplasmalogenase [Treponemataceae bacterium]